MLEPASFILVKITTETGNFDKRKFADCFFNTLKTHFVNHPEPLQFDAEGHVITSCFRKRIKEHLDVWLSTSLEVYLNKKVKAVAPSAKKSCLDELARKSSSGSSSSSSSGSPQSSAPSWEFDSEDDEDENVNAEMNNFIDWQKKKYLKAVSQLDVPFQVNVTRTIMKIAEETLPGFQINFSLPKPSRKRK